MLLVPIPIVCNEVQPININSNVGLTNQERIVDYVKNRAVPKLRSRQLLHTIHAKPQLLAVPIPSHRPFRTKVSCIDDSGASSRAR